MKHILFALLLIPPSFMLANTPWRMQPVAVETRWARQVSPLNALPEYPRPQMVRNNWQNLNGLWKYAITAWDAGLPSKYDGEILLPFPIESALSGVATPLYPTQRLWYKRSIIKPDTRNGKRILLHFGAVDWKATVYLNGKIIGSHLGGYQHFSFDITASLRPGENELVVSVFDPTNMGNNPHGKQTLRPRNILYTANSGIWQTVWMETVPPAYISSLYMTPDIDANCLELHVYTSMNDKDYAIEAIATTSGNKISSTIGAPGSLLELPVENPHLWSPDDPFLYQLEVRLLYKGKVVDTISSYFGMRKIEVRNERIYLNNKYLYNLGVLDQGYWPEGLYTAPTDSALLFDIQTIKDMGFNTIRKHVKLEPDRWYYHCDKTGILVWQDMVTCAGYSNFAASEFETENDENMLQLHNFPSIIVWVLFNEGWGKYDQQRLTEWMKKMDPSRLIDGHSGENLDEDAPYYLKDMWASSDIVDIHRYPGPALAPEMPGKARVLGEWGGVRVSIPGRQWNLSKGWGYIDVPAARFAEQYNYMVRKLSRYEKDGLSGSIYTQPYDVESEENGLMTYDREVMKIPIATLKKINAQVFAH
jgi:beta-galactosidase/beta-glucuronidase